LVGVSKNLASLSALPAAVLQARYSQLVNDDEFSESALREGLSKRARVINRLTTAISVFAGN
jgi:hypothetical protein